LRSFQRSSKPLRIQRIAGNDYLSAGLAIELNRLCHPVSSPIWAPESRTGEGSGASSSISFVMPHHNYYNRIQLQPSWAWGHRVSPRRLSPTSARWLARMNGSTRKRNRAQLCRAWQSDASCLLSQSVERDLAFRRRNLHSCKHRCRGLVTAAVEKPYDPRHDGASWIAIIVIWCGITNEN